MVQSSSGSSVAEKWRCQHASAKWKSKSLRCMSEALLLSLAISLLSSGSSGPPPDPLLRQACARVEAGGRSEEGQQGRGAKEERSSGSKQRR